MRPELILRKRMLMLSVIVLMLFMSVCVRVGVLSTVEAEALTARGVRQWTRGGVVAARRGGILSSDGQVIALSATAYIVSVNPRRVTDADRFADVVCPMLGLQRESVIDKAERKGYSSVMLKRQVSRETVDELRALQAQSDEMSAVLACLLFEEDSARVYPKGAFLTQALGLTTMDSVGQSGLEARYESVLAGVEGRMVSEVDAKARTLPGGQTVYIAPQTGSALRLTVDAYIQEIVERAMRECIEVNNAKSVCCIVMEPSTGAVLALCCKPDYDPSSPPRNDVAALTELMRITAISDAYEPGSTFKMITLAAALEAGVVSQSDTFTCTGSIRVDGDTIRCWKASHGTQSLREALMNSCNPAFVTIGLRLGVEPFYRYMRAFGFGTVTGIDLPGESAGILIGARYVKNVDLARIGFGQSVAVTPIQMLSAACAVVNGGRLMKPYIVSQVLAEDGTVLENTQPTVVSTPISAETSALMRSMLEDVVSTGGGRNAAVSGYRIGGKTGTAQVYKDGRISTDVHIGSFVGFAPADNPRLALIVIVNEADVPVDYGGTTAAPFARQILEDALSYLGVPRETGALTEEVIVPDVTGLALAEARAALRAVSLQTETDGVSDTVTAQTPAAGARITKNGRVMLYTARQEHVTAGDLARVPDVSGLSVVEASRTLRARGLTMVLLGSGLAVNQFPTAGSYVLPSSEVRVTFELPATHSHP